MDIEFGLPATPLTSAILLRSVALSDFSAFVYDVYDVYEVSSTWPIGADVRVCALIGA